ncbi:hypothetical protein JCM10213_005776 [Rhodosporidiobolus nylandii]
MANTDSRQEEEARKWNEVMGEIDAAAAVDPMTAEAAKKAGLMAAMMMGTNSPQRAEAMKLANGEVAVTEVPLQLMKLKGFAEGQLYVAEATRLSAEAIRADVALAAAVRREERYNREMSDFNNTLLTQRLDKTSDKLEAVSWLNAAISSLPQDLRTAKRPADPYSVPPMPEEFYVQPLAHLQTLCAANGPSWTRWYEEEIEKTGRSWQDVVTLARTALTTYVEQDEASVAEQFEEFWRTFNFEGEYKSEDGLPITAGMEAAAKGSKIVQKSPDYRANKLAHWAWVREIKKALPRWLAHYVPLSSNTTVMEALRSIQSIPKEAFEYRKQELAEKAAESATHRANLEALQAQLKALSASRDRQTMTQRQQAPAMSPFVAQRTGAQDAPDVPIFPKTAEAMKSGNPAHFSNYRSQKGLSVNQARPLVFSNDAAGKTAYEKAMTAFKKTYASDPANTPLTAAFPISPGSLPPASRSCDKCGVASDHYARDCRNTPASEDERMYRRAWRWVAAKRTAPAWGTMEGAQFNLIPEVDEYMARFADEIYGRPDQPQPNDALEVYASSPFHDDYETAAGNA